MGHLVVQKKILELNHLLCQHFGLDDVSANCHIATCDYSFQQMYDREGIADKLTQALNWLYLHINDVKDLDELLSVLQGQFGLYDDPTDFDKDARYVGDLAKDFRDRPTLHVGFHKWVHWNPNTQSFYISTDVKGTSYEYQPCTAVAKVEDKCHAVTYILNCLTTILCENVSIITIQEHFTAVATFLAAQDVVLYVNTGDLLKLIVDHTRVEWKGALPEEFLNMERTNLVEVNGNPIATLELGRLAAYTLSRPLAHMYKEVLVDLSQCMKSADVNVHKALAEYALALVGISTYWRRFGHIASKDNMFLPIQYNINNVVCSYNDIKTNLL